MTKALYKYYEDFGRMGSLEGLFIWTDEEYDLFMDNDFYWDELLGKHSEGEFQLNTDTVTKLDIPVDVVQVLEDNLGKTISGDLDFDYFREQLDERLDPKWQ